VLRRYEVGQDKQKDSVLKTLADRAVPFPTLTETAEQFNYPRLSEVKSNAARLAAKLKAEVDEIDKRREACLKTLTWLKDSGFLGKVDKGAEDIVKYLTEKGGLEGKGVLLSDARGLNRLVRTVKKLGVDGLEKKLGQDKEAATDTESKAAKFYKRVAEGDDSINGMIHDFYTLATFTGPYGRKISFAAALDPTWVDGIPAIPAR
jgi:hypothetical protein